MLCCERRVFGIVLFGSKQAHSRPPCHLAKTCTNTSERHNCFLTNAITHLPTIYLSFAQMQTKATHIIGSDQQSIDFYARRSTRLPITLVKLYRSPRARQHVLPRAGFCLSTPPWRARVPPAPARVAIMPPFFPRPLMARAVPCGRSHQPTWSRGSKVYKRSQRGARAALWDVI